MKRVKNRSSALLVLILSASMTMPGCRESTVEREPTGGQPEAKTVSRSQVSARAFLAQVFARYRTAKSYCDRAVAELSYTEGGTLETKRAPLHVWFDNNQLYVQAYDVQIFSDPAGIMAWMDDPATHGYDSQVLRTRTSRNRPQIGEILADPILRDRVAAGLAGPPPQIEWLFSKAPMKALFAPQHQFRFDNPGRVGQRDCRVVLVDADRQTYRFWVDENLGLVRRIDFPAMSLPPVAGRPPSQMNLRIELADASFDASRESPDHKHLPREPKYVSRFVPLPPAEPDQNIGSRPSKFLVQSIDGRIEMSDRGSDRELTIAVRSSGDEASLSTVRIIDQWQSQIPSSLRSRLRIIALADDNVASQVSGQVSYAVISDRDGRASDALRLTSGSLTIQDRTGRIVWVQSEFSAPAMVALGAVIADLAQGIDVPSRIRGQWQEQNEAYRKAIAKARVD